MAPKGAMGGGASAPGLSSPEKRKASKEKKDRSKVQSAWLATVSRTREKYPIPSLHMRISLTDGISRPRLGRWSVSRRSGNENIEVVRTKSQAGMLRPRRFPTIYKSNSRLFIDPFEHPLPERARPTSNKTDSYKQSVIVDLPERVQMHIASHSTEKHSVVEEVPNTLEIILAARIQQVQQPSSRFEELNDDASVHELEAVFPTASTPAEESHTPTAVLLCEADDPTALPTLDFLQRSFTMDVNQPRRPKISLSIPRSKSLHMLPGSGATTAALLMSPLSPSSYTTYRSLTQLPAMRYSIISPLTPIDMPMPMRPYSTISVPLFMEASDLAQAREEIPPLPTFAASFSRKHSASSSMRHSRQLQNWSAQQGEHQMARLNAREDNASSSSPSPSNDADDEDDEDGTNEPCTQTTRSMTRKYMAASINKPLPPEPQMVIPSILPPLAYKPRQVRITQAQENLPRSRYSPTHTGRLGGFRKAASTKNPTLDQAIEELEWRLSSICEQRSASAGPWPNTPIQVSRGLMLMEPLRSPPPVPRSTDSGAIKVPRRPIVRSNSAGHIIFQSKDISQKRARSCHDLRWAGAASDTADIRLEESETWYRTASERSSADLSHSVFSDADTDGTCQTEQSHAQDKAKEKEKEKEKVEVEVETEENCVINNAEMPQAMQSSSVPAEVCETVILRIMSHMTTLKDLFATAALNKGFYNAFKRHEMYLIKATLCKSSIAGWEFREISEETQLTPTAYLRQYSVDIYTMGMLKSLILVQCESFLRPVTIAGLVGADQTRSAEIDAAFWRVWTFCRLFGRSAGEDEDIEAQVDWLNGGELAREQDPSSSFGIGNGDGLSKSELYDMNELWTCLSVLVQTFHGRTGEARAVGIYEKCQIDSKRDEELLLEEWTWYLLTCGPSCILELAPGSFTTAKNRGWTEWSPPAPGQGRSRSKFFKEAMAQVYEARLAEELRAKSGKAQRTSKASHRVTRSEEARELDRRRQTAFAEELRSQRQHSPSKSEPWTFSDERPMSVYSQVVRALPHEASRISAQDLAAMPKPPSTEERQFPPKSTTREQTTPPRSRTPVLTSSSAVLTAADDIPTNGTGNVTVASPVITSGRVANDSYEIVDPADRAMTHLVDVLGFGKEAAKWALTRSETGHGVDVEKAVAILLHDSPPTSRASSRAEVHSPIEIESSTARPEYVRKRTPLQQRDSMVTTDDMTEREKQQANLTRMREKSYRVLGIGAPQGGKKFGSTLGRKLRVR
ncbi:hypothetical protein EPUS_03987 [Endocarpon pusillum Z07020]|uniref:UBA domain-containing protein n=1 Tax=Endocarpon pusillum (strain Z07020 / HMAS-L-300199) TaxID=1263415 RepID=U1GB82_ENDPU|nr:uncharacterized protein EPUS_03987 [Endocarpon pusillum Z07020]ERF69283.1 hypothetical protein EPUS_03987 [Endocarpon pusillum Z07020]